MPSPGEHKEIGWSHVSRGQAQKQRGFVGSKMSGAVFHEETVPCDTRPQKNPEWHLSLTEPQARYGRGSITVGRSPSRRSRTAGT
jgi:hypothetical protein